MVVSTVLKARSFRDVCFVSDSVAEAKPGAVINYNNRQSESSFNQEWVTWRERSLSNHE